MFNPFQKIELISAQIFSSMPARFRIRRRSAWSDANRHGQELDCFLEGPSFDRQGNLWLVDVPFGRIFRVSRQGDWDLVAHYDGWPNGLKFHRDGRIFICDYRRGLMLLDAQSGTVETLLDSVHSEGFKGLNDLHFASNGDLYFTDQGQTGIADATGRVYRLRTDGTLDRLVANVPSPNGITLSGSQRQCYVAVTRAQQVWRLPLMQDGNVSKAGVAIQLSGGTAGPDGIETDAEDGLVVCQLGVGVWRFDARMLPTHLVHTDDAQDVMANIAFGGDDLRTLFITGSLSGNILTARLPVPGRHLYGLA